MRRPARRKRARAGSFAVCRGKRGVRSCNVGAMDPTLMEQRFHLRESLCISERFEKSPNIDREYPVSGHLHICHAGCDAPVLPLVRESLVRAYDHVKDWFGYENDLPLALWMAPALSDLRYMTCVHCDEGWFCAPGSCNGSGIILFVSPRSCRRNGRKDVLTGLLAHEIAHHFIRHISHATVFSMKRREERDVPCWLEEGLCELIRGEIYPPLRQSLAAAGAGITHRYAPEELWNDLSSCEDPRGAYVQAYEATKSLVETAGKAHVIRLLYLNRTRDVNWTDLPMIPADSR